MEKIIKALNKNKEIIEDAINLDFKEWDYENSFEDIIKIINKEESKINKKENGKITFTMKNIAVIGRVNPKVIISLIAKFAKLDLNVTFFVEDKLLATNKTIISSISEEYNKFKIEVLKKNDDFYKVQKNFDNCLYIGNNEEYQDFSRRLTIHSVYQNFGEIFICLENKEFKIEMLELEKFAFENDIQTKYYVGNLEEAIIDINKKGVVDTVLILTKNAEEAYKIANEVYAENVYVNVNLPEKYEFNFDVEKLLLKKKIVIKD